MEQTYKWKNAEKSYYGFAIGMILFYYMKELVGRVSSLNFLEYITQYIDTHSIT